MDWPLIIIPLLAAWILDMTLGDPAWLPHPVVAFGNLIAFFTRRLNRGSRRVLKGGCMAIMLIAAVYAATWLLLRLLSPLPWLKICIETILIFYCLAGTTLIREVKMVFAKADLSLTEGRKQVGRIVGRDTGSLSDREVRTAALETLAENLSDGVIAPLFWYALLGVPGMLAYKMINTLDSMIGYKNDKYLLFGRVAAKIDDAANFFPARITALLMALASPRKGLLKFIRKYGRAHASPNSGYPEAALAGILQCRFGGPHHYFGKIVDKPFIGDTERDLDSDDLKKAVKVNRIAEIFAVAAALSCRIMLAIC